MESWCETGTCCYDQWYQVSLWHARTGHRRLDGRHRVPADFTRYAYILPFLPPFLHSIRDLQSDESRQIFPASRVFRSFVRKSTERLIVVLIYLVWPTTPDRTRRRQPRLSTVHVNRSSPPLPCLFAWLPSCARAFGFMLLFLRSGLISDDPVPSVPAFTKFRLCSLFAGVLRRLQRELNTSLDELSDFVSPVSSRLVSPIGVSTS